VFIKPKYGTENLMSDYKSTLNLPETGFPMRGDLAKREPGMLARWTDDDLYGIIRAAKKAKKPSFCMMALLCEWQHSYWSLG
jgi:isoleucyl-tRNA synthetase